MQHKIKRTAITCGSLVALSDLDTNNYLKVLKWKRQTNFNLNTDSTVDVPQPAIIESEFGDMKVTQIRQSHKHLSDKEIAQIIIEYQSGLTTYQLAEKYATNRHTISNHLKKHGVNVTKNKAQEKLNVEEVISMYAQMFTTEQIAKKFGVSYQTITSCLRANDVRIRSRWDY